MSLISFYRANIDFLFRTPLRRPSVDEGISDWHNELLEMVFETGYREFAIQNPYMITVDGEAKTHISYFFIKPWWGNELWGCKNKRLHFPNRFARNCPEICEEGEICGQCRKIPFTASRDPNIVCAEIEDEQ